MDVFLRWALLTATCAFSMRAAPQPDFDPYTFRYPDDDLGAVYTPTSTTIKLWAPTAKAVSIALFDNPTNRSGSSIPLACDYHGIWSAAIAGDLDGKYYLYDITRAVPGETRTTQFRVNDPYARGCSANTGRTLIYDAAKTCPEGWDHDQFVTLKNPVDAVLYEVHIRDFSVNTNSGISVGNRGKYLGMVEEGTKSRFGQKTGLDHLVELGITHVHLLPVNDYAAGDERQNPGSYTWYNWGYNPVLYNTPEGSYASDPDGPVRQTEFKRMVQAFHRHHIGVVLDVVYNHTASTGSHPSSIFDKVFPNYYYRRDASGRYANGTGCGNEFASEKPMARKFIVDSIKYWVREYHVDGFRFDLMGMLDRDTMLEVYREAKKLNPNAILYGEGWKGEEVLPAADLMTQGNVRGTGIAAFNDGIRDNIKGDAAHGPAPGFVQGAGPPYGGTGRFLLNIKGQSTGKGRENIDVYSPNETINYASAHDDHCLWDKLRLSAPAASTQDLINMDKLAAGIVLTVQGVPFLHAGDEFLRSKKLVKNSYNNNDSQVNPLDWDLKSSHSDVFNFYKGMISLRKAHPAFRMADRVVVDRSFEFAKDLPPNLVAYLLRNNANGDSWKNILVAYNGSAEARDLNAKGKWAIVASAQKAGTEPLQPASDKIHIEPFSLVVAHTAGPCLFPNSSSHHP
jgi:pullulanase